MQVKTASPELKKIMDLWMCINWTCEGKFDETQGQLLKYDPLWVAGFISKECVMTKPVIISAIPWKGKDNINGLFS